MRNKWSISCANYINYGLHFEYGRVTMSEDDNLSDKDDRLIQRYDTILKESALLTTF